MSKVYEVYHCYHKGELVYVGQGIKGRSKHCDSGCSHVYELNKLHFTGDGEPLKVVIVKISDSKAEVENIEKEHIMCLKPKLNTVFTNNDKRQKRARTGKDIKRSLLDFRDEIVPKHPTDRFVEKYNLLCEDFYDFYGYEKILEGGFRFYSAETFKDFGKPTLMYLSRYLRKPRTNYETDNSPYALFCRGLLYLYDIDLKSLLYNRSQKDFLTY